MATLPGVSDSKESACSGGDLGSIPGSGRSPGEENGYPLQYSCLENSMNRGAWQATVPGVPRSQTRLSNVAICSHVQCALWENKELPWLIFYSNLGSLILDLPNVP